jgi:glyoxylase-like metal-dependent hydrolase (beta-lactamase superfamily II)
MPATKDFREITGVTPDNRIRIFRSSFGETDDKVPMDVDAYVVITERYIVICDTLLCPEDMEQVCQALQDETQERQFIVVNSHADWDHTWGNCYFTRERNVPIIGHEQCRFRMLTSEAQEGLDDYKQRFPYFQQVVLQPPTTTYTHHLAIYGGDLTLELLHTPGHYIDHSAIWIPEIQTLLGFDTVEKPIPLIEGPNLVGDMFTTLERLVSLKPQHLLCAHGNTYQVSALEENLRYLREVESRCKVLLEPKRPTEQELEQAAELINYPFENIRNTLQEPINTRFYSWAHDTNIRYMLQYLTETN